MIDLLTMRSNEAVREECIRSTFSDGFSFFKVTDKIYKDVVVVKTTSGHVLTVKQGPIHHIPSATQIILNPANWTGMTALASKLSLLLPLDSLVISRIDHKVDLNKSINSVYSSLRVKGKQKASDFSQRRDFNRGRLNGFYIGRKPEVYCIYDKAYQLQGMTLKKVAGSPEGHNTRIELRQFKHKIKEPHFLNLDYYVKNPPFDKIQFLKIDESHSIDKLPKLAKELCEVGFQNTFASNNVHGNFKRDLGKHFQETNLETEINKTYSEQLQKFLER